MIDLERLVGLRWTARLLLAGIGLHAGGQSALACAVCFGDPHSDMARGAVAGVMFLAGVTGAVLATIASVAAVWTRKARRLASQEEKTA